MRILILADEGQTLERLQHLIFEVAPGATLIGKIPTVEETIGWFRHNPMPDLIFMDIHLADGSSCRLFNKIKITCPVIFTTAYDNYALQGIQVSSREYLLQPIDEAHIKNTLSGLNSPESRDTSCDDYTAISKLIQQRQRKYKDRFIIKLGDTIKTIPVADIAYFYTENKSNFVCTNEGKRLPIDFTLDQLEELLNRRNFFRLNRQFIIGYHAIDEMKAHTRSRVIVKLSPPTRLDTKVAIDRAHDFRSWLSE